jgi:hypothetical protein
MFSLTYRSGNTQKSFVSAYDITNYTHYADIEVFEVTSSFRDIENAAHHHEKEPGKPVLKLQDRSSQSSMKSLVYLTLASISLLAMSYYITPSQNTYQSEEPSPLTANIRPQPEIASKVLNLQSGQVIGNKSFAVSRLLRFLESRYAARPGGLVIEVLNATAPTSTKNARLNWPTVTVYSAQLLAAFEYTLLSGGDISVLLMLGTAWCALHARKCLPVWNDQKRFARKDSGTNASYALLRSNGHRHVFIINNTYSDAWNLVDLASAGLSTYDYAENHERPMISALFIILLFLTLLATQLSYIGTIFLVCIMSTGQLALLATF